MYKYNKESGIFTYHEIDANGDVIFSCTNIGIISVQTPLKGAQVLHHGPAEKVMVIAHQMRQSGQLFNFIESEAFDVEGLNKMTRGVEPTK